MVSNDSVDTADVLKSLEATRDDLFERCESGDYTGNEYDSIFEKYNQVAKLISTLQGQSFSKSTAALGQQKSIEATNASIKEEVSKLKSTASELGTAKQVVQIADKVLSLASQVIAMLTKD